MHTISKPATFYLFISSPRQRDETEGAMESASGMVFISSSAYNFVSK